MELGEMTREELLALKEEITQELKSRETQGAQKVIVDLPTFDSRHKNWIKVLTGVDREKSDGYAFQGDFARPGSTVELPVGTLLLYYYGDGSVKNYTVEVRVVRVTQNGLESTGIGTSRANWKTGGWALDIRDAAAELF